MLFYFVLRSEQRAEREDAGTSVSDEQMRAGPLRYPVDRYLVESSRKFEMVNIIDGELWNSEPALRPEDELVLRKLHDMLQSTANDLKQLSGELNKFHEPRVQLKTAPIPLDEDFNEKVHIEEVVNAKFHGNKIVDEVKPRNVIKAVNLQRPKVMNAPAQVNTTIKPVNRNLGISRTRIIQIDDSSKYSDKNKKLNNGKVYKAPIAYSEFSFKHNEPEVIETPRKLQVQDMPRINIRSELREQKVLQLDIIPDSDDVKELNTAKSNVSVVAVRHETVSRQAVEVPESTKHQQTNTSKPIRKISKMSTCDSSGSANNTSSDAQVKLNTQKRLISTIRNSPKSSARSRNKKNSANIDQGRRPGLNLDEWKKKLNIVYGSSSKTKLSHPKLVTKKSSPKKTKIPTTLNNAEYIPYSQLTVGGVRASDIEKEILNLPNKNDVPLSPILDKILSSRENSFNKESPRQHRIKKSPNILTTSDENLLQEVIDIEKSVSETLSKNFKRNSEAVVTSPTVSSKSNSNGNESYVDDFEDEKSDHSEQSENQQQSDDDALQNNTTEKNNASSSDENNDVAQSQPPSKPNSNPNATYTKPNLSFKDSVDIFEFIHSIDMQDSATQSNTTNKISPKETQTSPIKDKPGLQPTIHNDLWPTIDPRREVEKMFEMEKDFIKKLIIDEYGDLLEKNINKPSTSNENKEDVTVNNVSTVQKNTQTSPAHVKSVMTSPKRTKTRTTSPFTLSVPAQQQTSPMIQVTDEEHKIDVKIEAEDISINLSSPRFSLRLPQTSQEVISNLQANSRSSSRTLVRHKSNKTYPKPKQVSCSSSSIDADNSSSELSSLGEIKMKKMRKRVPTISECSSSSKYSSDFQSMGIVPLRSEGEVSLGQTKSRSRKIRESEGETSFDIMTN